MPDIEKKNDEQVDDVTNDVDDDNIFIRALTEVISESKKGDGGDDVVDEGAPAVDIPKKEKDTKPVVTKSNVLPKNDTTNQPEYLELKAELDNLKNFIFQMQRGPSPQQAVANQKSPLEKARDYFGVNIDPDAMDASGEIIAPLVSMYEDLQRSKSLLANVVASSGGDRLKSLYNKEISKYPGLENDADVEELAYSLYSNHQGRSYLSPESIMEEVVGRVAKKVRPQEIEGDGVIMGRIKDLLSGKHAQAIKDAVVEQMKIDFKMKDGGAPPVMPKVSGGVPAIKGIEKPGDKKLSSRGSAISDFIEMVGAGILNDIEDIAKK